jgi:hypothetical protein
VLTTAYKLSDSASHPLQPMTVDGRTILVAKTDASAEGAASPSGTEQFAENAKTVHAIFSDNG